MKNRYEICGDVTKIYINSPKYGEKVVLIDTEDLPKVKQYSSWYIDYNGHGKSFYINTVVLSTRITMSRLILCLTDRSFKAGYINHDTLDNRKQNLRIVTTAQSSQNRLGAQVNNKSSGIRDVTAV